ncbi:hypothetical protein KFL_000900010 [Klebsormidium nitens]|uniref:F-box domain-containing protein n=1 Tax=Klebsormidium nitens TaxID=105231 RepID=A0A0U9HIY5_KLENI|nr:hypothetical protein KFL_000900010 [Klebsormidium nitens]|eukprot:GAQ81746.1 hypothetical protein KFL_000900010 [Klebsormidium nitens]
MGHLSSDEEELEAGLSRRRYEKLHLWGAFERRSDYAEACQELAIILRQAYASASKAVQVRLYSDTTLALQLLGRMDGRKQQRGALALVRAAEAVFPRQRKAAAAKEFKSAALESKRRQKKERASSSLEGDEGVSGSAEDLPSDALRTVFGSLDAASLATAGCVCRAWREIADDDTLWEAHFAAVFGADRTSETAAALVRLSVKETEPVPDKNNTSPSSRKQPPASAEPNGRGDPVLKSGTVLPGWKEAFRSAWRNQSPAKVFASNRAYCKECREPLWVGAPETGTNASEQGGRHEHKLLPWGPQQVAAWVTNTWESSGESSSEEEAEEFEAEGTQVRAQRKLWAIQRP